MVLGRLHQNKSVSSSSIRPGAMFQRVRLAMSVVLKLSLLALNCGDVDRNRKRIDTIVLPNPRLPTRFIEHPFSEFDDQSGFLRDQDELCGGISARAQDGSSGPGLRARRCGRESMYLGLVLQGEAAALDGRHQFPAEDSRVRTPLGRTPCHEHRRDCGRHLLRDERKIGLHQHRVRSVQLVGVARNADAGRDARGLSVDYGKLFERSENFLSQLLA